MFNMENLRNAWDHTFENITVYGDFEGEIRDSIEYVANDEIDRAGRALEAIHAEDHEDLEDQARDIVEDMVDTIRGYAEDLPGNGFDSETADAEISRIDVLDYFSENESECDEALLNNSSLGEFSSISDAILTSVFLHISGRIMDELSEFVSEIEDMTDDIMEYMTA